MFKRINTLANRLALAYAGAFAVFLLFAFVIAYFSFSALLSSRLTEDLEEDLDEMRLSFANGGLREVLDDVDNELRTGDAADVFFRVVDNNKELFISDTTSWENLRSKLSDFITNGEPAIQKIQFESQEYPALVISGLLSDTGPLITIGESTEQNGEILEILLGLFILMAILVMPLAYAVGWWVSQRAVKGIKAIGDAAVDIERGHLDRQVDFKGAGLEIQQLGDRFNAMAQRIQQLINEMREMIDNIAHDLRSPITRIRATAETLSHSTECSHGALQVLHECDGLIRLINTTLDVSEAEAGVVPAHKELVDLGQLTQDVCELFEPAFEQRQLQLHCAIGPAAIQGFRTYLQRLIANLLDNAVKYTPKGGNIYVKVYNGNGHVALIVEDSGVGINQKDIDRVFDRFFRGDQTRQEKGSGLGLSFCRAVARLHYGNIQVISDIGKGSRFTLTFPTEI